MNKWIQKLTLKKLRDERNDLKKKIIESKKEIDKNKKLVEKSNSELFGLILRKENFKKEFEALVGRDSNNVSSFFEDTEGEQFINSLTLEKTDEAITNAEALFEITKFIKYDFIGKMRRDILNHLDLSSIEPRSFESGLRTGINFYENLVQKLKEYKKFPKKIDNDQ